MKLPIDVEKLATLEQFEQMADWMAKLSGRNAIDTTIFSYPSLFYKKASRGDVNLLYMPVQTCFVYESLAINPANSAADTAESLKIIFAVLHDKAVENGFGESYFLCSDTQTCQFAEHRGMENLTDNDRLKELIAAAENVVNGQTAEPIEQAQAVGRLDIALNEYKKNPGLKTYRKKHIRPKVQQAKPAAPEIGVAANV